MKRTTFLLLILLSSLNTFAQTIARADSVFLSGNYRAAAGMYELALKDPATAKDVRSWFRLGASWAAENDHKKALAAYEKAWKINSRQPGLRLAMVKSYTAVNNNDKAFAMLDSAIAAGFGNYKLLENDPQLRSLKIDPRYKATHDRLLAAAFPCLALAEARVLDFWLGEWTVYNTANPTVQTGSSKITKQSQGCVILESWTSVGAHEGVSINYYDPTSKTWKQKWAGSGQDIIEFEGRFANKELVYNANSTTPQGKPSKTRMTFTDMAPGKVRQHGEQSLDEGKTWTTTFDFIYIRKPDGANP